MKETRLTITKVLPINVNGVYLGNIDVKVEANVSLDSQISDDLEAAIIKQISENIKNTVH